MLAAPDNVPPYSNYKKTTISTHSLEIHTTHRMCNLLMNQAQNCRSTHQSRMRTSKELKQLTVCISHGSIVLVLHKHIAKLDLGTI
jgi:hypothetical protein